MRGLIYKDVTLFFKSIEKKMILIASAAVILLFVKGGIYSGLLATIMISMTIGMQNVLMVSNDEKARWGKYQMAMPVDKYHAVASKYISVVVTLGVSILGSIVFNVAAGIIYNGFDVALFGISVLAAVLLPLFWAGICIPMTYWFGFRTSQLVSLLVVFPFAKLLGYFEDGPGITFAVDSWSVYLIWACIITVVVFGVSFLVSVGGYGKKIRA